MCIVQCYPQLTPIDDFCIGQHPLICGLLKGAFNQRPPRPELWPYWSVDKILETLKAWSPISDFDLKNLSFKTVMLVALASAKRPRSLHLLSTEEGFCEISETRVRFQPVQL